MSTSAEEDYLKVILKMKLAGEDPTTGALAARIGVRPASVTGMLQRLAKRRLVRYQPYRAAELTDEGQAVATAILRRHRLIELFLVDVLDFTWDRVHAEAERWEHAVSEKAVARMDEILGHPVRDPHGAPIPSLDGAVSVTLGASLAEAKEGDKVQVEQIPDDDVETLGHLKRSGLLPDAVIEVLAKEPGAAMMSVRVNGIRRQVAVAIAEQITVARVAEAIAIATIPNASTGASLSPRRAAKRRRGIGTRKARRHRPAQ